MSINIGVMSSISATTVCKHLVLCSTFRNVTTSGRHFYFARYNITWLPSPHGYSNHQGEPPTN